MAASKGTKPEAVEAPEVIEGKTASFAAEIARLIEAVKAVPPEKIDEMRRRLIESIQTKWRVRPDDANPNTFDLYTRDRVLPKGGVPRGDIAKKQLELWKAGSYGDVAKEDVVDGYWGTDSDAALRAHQERIQSEHMPE